MTSPVKGLQPDRVPNLLHWHINGRDSYANTKKDLIPVGLFVTTPWQIPEITPGPVHRLKSLFCLVILLLLRYAGSAYGPLCRCHVNRISTFGQKSHLKITRWHHEWMNVRIRASGKWHALRYTYKSRTKERNESVIGTSSDYSPVHVVFHVGLTTPGRFVLLRRHVDHSAPYFSGLGPWAFTDRQLTPLWKTKVCNLKRWAAAC